MKLQNGYKVIYEEIADGKRTFFADKMDGNGAKQLENTDGTPFTIGKYKLVFEKDGHIWGSETGKIEDGVCFDAFDEVLVEHQETQEPAPAAVEPENEEPYINDEGDDEKPEVDPEDEE